MQVKDDTCYIKHIVDSEDEIVGIIHYQEIYENGYTADTYVITPEYISFEDAEFLGHVPNTKEAGTFITKEQFVRWVEQIEEAIKPAERILQQAATPLNRNIEVGDYIFYNNYMGMKVVEIQGSRIYAQSIYLKPFDSGDEIDWMDESLDYILSRSCLITAEAFMAVHDYIRGFCRQMIDEIKSHAETTEYI